MMNGETKSILDAVEKFRDQQHKENLSKFDEIFDWIRKRPCDMHQEKMAGLQHKIDWLWTAYIVVVIGGIVLRLWIQ